MKKISGKKNIVSLVELTTVVIVLSQTNSSFIQAILVILAIEVSEVLLGDIEFKEGYRLGKDIVMDVFSNELQNWNISPKKKTRKNPS